MHWAKGLPKDPGWYWFRNLKYEEYREPYIYRIRDYAGDMAIGNSVLTGWKRAEEGEWAGPLLPPEEA